MAYLGTNNTEYQTRQTYKGIIMKMSRLNSKGILAYKELVKGGTCPKRALSIVTSITAYLAYASLLS